MATGSTAVRECYKRGSKRREAGRTLMKEGMGRLPGAGGPPSGGLSPATMPFARDSNPAFTAHLSIYWHLAASKGGCNAHRALCELHTALEVQSLMHRRMYAWAHSESGAHLGRPGAQRCAAAAWGRCLGRT